MTTGGRCGRCSSPWTNGFAKLRRRGRLPRAAGWDPGASRYGRVPGSAERGVAASSHGRGPWRQSTDRARRAGTPMPLLIPQVDRDGNERAGIRLPDIAAPLGTYTGGTSGTPRSAPDQVVPLLGSCFRLQASKAERERARDPRASIEERYRAGSEYSGPGAGSRRGTRERSVPCWPTICPGWSNTQATTGTCSDRSAQHRQCRPVAARCSRSTRSTTCASPRQTSRRPSGFTPSRSEASSLAHPGRVRTRLGRGPRRRGRSDGSPGQSPRARAGGADLSSAGAGEDMRRQLVNDGWPDVGPSFEIPNGPSSCSAIQAGSGWRSTSASGLESTSTSPAASIPSDAQRLPSGLVRPAAATDQADEVLRYESGQRVAGRSHPAPAAPFADPAAPDRARSRAMTGGVRRAEPLFERVGRQSSLSMATSHVGSSMPGALPPPTADTPGTSFARQPLDRVQSRRERLCRARGSHRRSSSACAARDRRRRAARRVFDERRLERRVRHLVHAQRAHQRMPPDPLDERRAADDDAGLRTAEQLVAAEAADIDARRDRCRVPTARASASWIAGIRQQMSAAEILRRPAR